MVRQPRNDVMPGLVPGTQPSTSAGARREMDPGDKHRDDTVELDPTQRALDIPGENS
jgi:hypothetical protein